MARKMKLADIDEVFARLSKVNPDPKTELEFTNPYTLVVAVALSAHPLAVIPVPPPIASQSKHLTPLARPAYN